MGLPHIPHTIIYKTNGSALKNKQKSIYAQNLVTSVQYQKNLQNQHFYMSKSWIFSRCNNHQQKHSFL